MDAENADIYLKIYASGYSFWLTGYKTIEYTVTDVPDIWNNAHDYYVWAWNEDASDKYDASLLPGDMISATLPADIDGFLLLKVQRNFDWSSDDWNNGLEGQSRDIYVQEGVTSYPFELKVTLTITGIPDEYLDKDIYGYYWTPGEFVKGTVNAQEKTFTVTFPEEELEGFLLVVVENGVAPKWNGEGFICQTPDIAYVGGTLTYAWPGVK